MKERVSTGLACGADVAWEAVETTALFEHVASPVLTFTAVGGALPERWTEGFEATLSLSLFGVLPVGRHTIRIRRLDPVARVLETSESGAVAPIWNHRIEIASGDTGDAIYTDEVDVRAGWRTPLVWLFAEAFYRYRQSRWRRLAPRLAARRDASVAAARRASS